MKPLLSLLVVCTLVACGGKSGRREPTPALQLVAQDIESFLEEPVPGLVGAQRARFDAIFGALHGEGMKRFVTDRAKQFVPITETTFRLSPPSWRFRDWTKLPPPPARPGGGPDRRSRMAAANLGAEFFFQGLLDAVPVSVSFRGITMNIDNTRVGLVLLGESYTDLVYEGDVSYAIPARFRKEILIHESRHSDCTGGIARANLAVARAATSYAELMRVYPDTTCGHFHSLCPVGHSLSGIPACDDKPWGAYMMGWLYLEAFKSDPAQSAVDDLFLTAMRMDTKRRLQFDVDAAIDLRAAAPDLSSGGVR